MPAGKVFDAALGEAVDCLGCYGAGTVPAAGVINVFRPRALEYVCRGDESEKDLDELVAKGVIPVRVVELSDTDALPMTEGRGGEER